MPCPRAWRDEHHVRRYGFHGSSYAWVARRTAALLGRDPADVRMVVLHLGQRRQRVRGRRRAQRRDVDGALAGRGAGHGHPVG